MKEFNFEIKGNDVEDLLKVVNGNSNKQPTNSNVLCPICGSNDRTLLNWSWVGNKDSKTYTKDVMQCNNCLYKEVK